ncbi:MAG: HDOD domain-containing protein [Spirochaetaceae bacterium]|jgi:HD-like signal output (HDOD) protein/RNA binding exosome subunit|nr:HDOD domain-containing protein [Spirochaetaceae bacterium]
MFDEQILVVDEQKIRKAVQSGIPFTITSYTLPHETEVYIGQVIAMFLKVAGHEGLRDYIEYCIQELAVNAKKANTKRVYFMEKKLDLLEPEQYKKGMQNFKKDTLENLAHYLQLQKDKGLYIKINLLYKTDAIQIEVRNNVAVSKIELMRIHEKLARSRQYNSLEDAFSQVLDDSEGAGLGLVVLVLMLKKMGLTEDCFDIMGTEKETVARLLIPLDQTKINNIADLSKAIVEQVNSLPQFPENILMVQKLTSDPKSDMIDIARRISVDPAMTADIIKIVNSPQYMLGKRCDNISDAVKIVGIKGIKNLLYSYGTQKILGDDTQSKKDLWEHSYRCAFYAYNLVRNFCPDKSILDDAYVGGMLHDMGKIVFDNTHPDLVNKMKKFCVQKSIADQTFEDVSSGMNHAEIGGLIAEKWNFPENLVASIRFHHDPSSAPDAYKDIVDAVYFANMLCEIEFGVAVPEQLDADVLAYFGLTSNKQVKKIVERFSQGFRKESGSNR